jgi:PAS domain S-box-containing protein
MSLGSTSDRPAATGGSIHGELIRSHQSIAFIGLGMLVVSLLATFWLRSHSTRLALLRGPTLSNSALASEGLQRSLAGLRGWMVLREPSFKQERIFAWEQEIWPALANLEALRADGSDEFGEQLEVLRRIFTDLNEWQWWIEDIAQTPGNEPARVLYDRDVGPMEIRMLQGIRSLIDDEMQAAETRKNLLGAMDDLRLAVMEVEVATARFLRNGRINDENTIRHELRLAVQLVGDLAARKDELSVHQLEIMSWLEAEVVAYHSSLDRVISKRKRADWNLAKHLMAHQAHPLSKEASTLLTELSREQNQRMQNDAAEVVHISNVALLVLVVLILVMAVSARVLSKRKADQITGPLTALAGAATAFARGELTTDLPISRDDEVGQLTRSFNTMRTSLEESNTNLQEKEEHLRAVVTSIITIDTEGTIRSFNLAAEEIFGYRVNEVLGQNVSMLMPDPYHSEHDDYIHNYLDGGVAKVIGVGREVVGRRKDGSEFPMDLAVSEMSIGDTRMFAGIIRDITERKQAEEDLRLALERAEQANLAKSQFLANMSHELRTPLNAVIGYSEMLMESAEDDDRDQDAEDSKRIEAAGKHLLTLINEILDLSKVEAGQIELHLEDIDIIEMIKSVQETVGPLMSKNENRFVLELGEDIGTMNADLTRVRQVLFNLLSNAAKFTHEGTITLTVEREKRPDNEWLAFHVADTGIGMTSVQLSKVFDPFQQADSSTTREYGGTGLGLTICREFCQLMGGDITVESEAGRGSVFTTRLPAEVRSQGAETLADGAVAETSSPDPDADDAETILVIDDDPSSRNLIERTLAGAGYRVLTAAGGEEGLALAREQRPILITLDVMMPSMDGWSVLAALKEDPLLRDIPVIMNTMVQDENLGFSLGAADYLTKPMERDRLIETVNKRIGGGPGTVLVVEDSLETREMVCRMLRNAGWTTYEAENGEIALEKMELKPDIILLDLMMPVMDGFRFVELARQNPAYRSVPIVVLTAKELTSEDRQQLENSVDRVIQKGTLSKEELLQQLRSNVESALKPG